MPLYIGFSPKIPDAEAITAALRDEIIAARKSGRLAEILSHYGLEDWQP